MADAIDCNRLRIACDAFGPVSYEWRPPELQIDPPAALSELRAVQQQLSVLIPDPLATFFLSVSAAVNFFWNPAKEKFTPPPALRDVWGGQCHIEINSLKYLCESWFTEDNLIRSAPHGGRCRFDYTELFPFMQIDNGDMLCLAIGPQHPGRVVYWAHEGNLSGNGLDDSHLPIIAASLPAFLSPWFALGCPGPEIWCLQPFLDPSNGRLSATTEAAVAWRRFVGLT